MLPWIGVHLFVMNLKNTYFSLPSLAAGVSMTTDLTWTGTEGPVSLSEPPTSENPRLPLGLLSSVTVLMV